MEPQNLQELEEAIADFVKSFKLVFDYDWETTKLCIPEEYLIKENGTFIQPGVSNESSNWWNRGSLLSRYRHLIEVLDKNGIQHSFDTENSPDDLGEHEARVPNTVDADDFF